MAPDGTGGVAPFFWRKVCVPTAVFVDSPYGAFGWAERLQLILCELARRQDLRPNISALGALGPTLAFAFFLSLERTKVRTVADTPQIQRIENVYMNK